MANVRNSNTYFIDATGALNVKNIRVTHIVVSATAAGAILVLKDVTTANTKVNLRVATDGTSSIFDFQDNPLVFPNGIDVTTATNVAATCVIRETQG